jgi:hypothetical protein
MLKHEYKPGFAKIPGWEHKDASYIVENQKMNNAKGMGGLVGFVTGISLFPAGIEKLDQLVNMPSPVGAGLMIAGTALITYLGVKAGERIANYENNKYRF